MPMPQKLCTPVAGLLLAGFLALSFVASARKSTTADEPSHIASGLSYVATGEFVANLQHPPLLKELSGLSLLAGGIRWPDNSQTSDLMEHGAAGLEWGIGDSIISDGGAAHVMAWARLPFPFVATLLGIVIYAWGRRLFGEHAALGAVFLYVLDPTIAAHANLVTTDVGLAAFVLLFLFALWRYLERPDRARAIQAGLAMGAMLCTKFSAVAVIPVAVGLVAAAAVWPIEVGSRNGGARPRAVRYAGGLLVAGLAGIAVIDALYLFSGGLYISGFRLVGADYEPGYLMFMSGQLAQTFDSYFAVAYLLKEPLPSIVLAVVGLVLLWRHRAFAVLTRLFVCLPPLVLFVAYTLLAADLGVRYIIPVFPFTFLVGGLALATLLRSRAIWMRGTAALLCGWLIVAAVGIWPDDMSYFNELACLTTPSRIGLDGGSRCGTQWLDDSNVDWGQGLIQLNAWLAQHAAGRTVHLAAFGQFPPQAYGIVSTAIRVDDIAVRPAAGLYVLNAHLVARLPAIGDYNHSGAWSWIRATPPTAVVGHSMFVYDLGADLHTAADGRRPEP